MSWELVLSPSEDYNSNIRYYILYEGDTWKAEIREYDRETIHLFVDSIIEILNEMSDGSEL